MATNGNGDSKRRLEILEKAYLEDRERWRANDERWRKNDERLAEMLLELRRQREEFQEDFQDVMKVLVKHDRQIRKLEESQAASLQILRRLMEK